MKTGDICFVDTNILLGTTDTGRETHEHCRAVFRFALENGVHLALNGQVIREYLVVATRGTERNGFGLDAGQALGNIDEFIRRAAVLEESEEVANQLCTLVSNLQITGNQIHDANIVATMIVHSVPALVTENEEDFRLFDAVEVIRPGEFLR